MDFVSSPISTSAAEAVRFPPAMNAKKPADNPQSHKPHETTDATGSASTAKPQVAKHL
jgi:hypothetical protein